MRAVRPQSGEDCGGWVVPRGQERGGLQDWVKEHPTQPLALLVEAGVRVQQQWVRGTPKDRHVPGRQLSHQARQEAEVPTVRRAELQGRASLGNSEHAEA